ncbi:hypothetical protein [Streptomyces canus]|uniref:hypothetical protein n=1 Tax=Streptomyces canus TaxID=58343 RepID=UPI00371B1D94
MLEASEAVPCEGLGESANDVRRALSRLLERGPDSTESDCDPLFSALAGTPTGGTPSEPACTALESLRAQDSRLSPYGDHRPVLDDEIARTDRHGPVQVPWRGRT